MRDIFAFSDIHGVWDLYKAIMDYCHEQDPEAMIVYCGDACDRGTDGYRIMKDLLDNPYVIYLKGNHEDLFVQAAREIKRKFNFENIERDKVETVLSSCKNFDYKYSAIQNSLYNGGLATLTDWILDNMPMDLIQRIEQLPLTFVYNNIDFCHAGSTYKTFKEINDKESDGIKVDNWDAEFVLWSRTTLDIGWEPNRICIFGHTPTPYLENFIKDFKWPENCDITPVLYKGTVDSKMTGWKLDMDTGAAFLGRAYVLNVLTMKAQGFKDNDFDNKEIEVHNVEKIEVIQF